MRYLLFNLQGVPDDEADAIREILEQHDIFFYETSEGRWRLGLAAIWLPNTHQKEQAEELIKDYQKRRYESFERERNHLSELGVLKSFLLKFYMQPLQVSAALLGIVLVLMISILPFV